MLHELRERLDELQAPLGAFLSLPHQALPRRVDRSASLSKLARLAEVVQEPEFDEFGGDVDEHDIPGRTVDKAGGGPRGDVSDGLR